MARLAGHWWTLTGKLRHQLAPPPTAGEPWSTTLPDPRVGSVLLSGRLHRLERRAPSADGDGTLLVLVHGLGGSADSAYVRSTTARLEALAAAGSPAPGGPAPGGPAPAAILRLNVRGADRSGEDLFHAGLTDDLAAALADPALAGFERIAVLGFSLGGHLALRYASLPGDPRLAAVAAICAPVDLAAAAAAIDRREGALYRRYLLRHLVEIYAAVAARRPLPVPVERLARVRTIVEFDELAVAPRFGFASAADYYARASVAPHLGRLRVPALVVAAADDPMVDVASLRPWLEPPPAGVTVRWQERGGHVGFPPVADLALGDGTAGLAPELQVVRWLLARPLAAGAPPAAGAARYRAGDEETPISPASPLAHLEGGRGGPGG